VAASGPGQNLALTLASFPRRGIYVRVTAVSSADAFAIGRYALVTTYNGLNTVTPQRIESVLRKNYDFLKTSDLEPLFRNGTAPVFLNDLHTNDRLLTATPLNSTEGFDKNTRFEAHGTLSDLTDADFYEIRSPQSVGSGTVLDVTVDAAELQSLQPLLAVFDETFQFRSPVILRNGNGTFTIQIRNIEANKAYYVKVVATSEVSRYRTGNYTMKARFTDSAEEQVTLIQGTLSSSQPRQIREINLNHSMIFNFALETNRNRNLPRPDIGTQVTLYDADGNEIHRIVTFNDSTRSANGVLLTPGKYFVRINSTSRDNSRYLPLNFRLLASVISDPVGPIGTNPTQAPPTTGTLDDHLTTSPPLVSPPATVANDTATENPYVYEPVPDPVHLFEDYQDWYWYFGVQ
jgi:hypothetical protein